MEFTTAISTDKDIAGNSQLNIHNYFELMSSDKDEVIMLINYYLEKGETSETVSTTTNKRENKLDSKGRIRVNDKTATGGWF